MREGQSSGLEGGSVVFDEGLEDGRGFLAIFLKGMGGDDDDFNDKGRDSCRLR